MNRLRSLNFALVIFVLIIMIASSALAGIILLFLDSYNFFIEINSTKILLLISGLLTSTIIGTILTFPIGNYLLKPLNQLIDGTREVTKGNFNIKVDQLKMKHEVGELIRSFNIMTKELSNTELFRRDFINNFSHEFKTPIVSIRGFARQLKNPDLTRDKQAEYVDIIIREAERLSNMSSNILLLSKLENQEIVTDKKLFSLDEQIRNCILLLQMEWEKKFINFQLDLQAVYYHNNEEMLSHIWLNLIGNAIKFSPEGGRIRISCYNDNENIRVDISDEGMGMSHEEQEHLFEMFYQGDKAHALEGNGLGLSLVKRIVDLSRGKISVESKLGQGTDIRVLLPR